MRLKDEYQKKVIPQMMEKFHYSSRMAVPRIEKVVVNTGFGRQVAGQTPEERRKIEQAVLNDLSLICGQKAVLTRAKKAIAGFKIKKGMPLGAKVTLRRRKMYDFLERLIHIALPRSRDFRGLDPKSVDGQGNLTIGLKEQIVFPEVLSEKAKNIFGLEITVVTNAKKREEAIELLKLLGFPFFHGHSSSDSQI